MKVHRLLGIPVGLLAVQASSHSNPLLLLQQKAQIKATVETYPLIETESLVVASPFTELVYALNSDKQLIRPDGSKLPGVFAAWDKKSGKPITIDSKNVYLDGAPTVTAPKEMSFVHGERSVYSGPSGQFDQELYHWVGKTEYLAGQNSMGEIWAVAYNSQKRSAFYYGGEWHQLPVGNQGKVFLSPDRDGCAFFATLPNSDPKRNETAVHFWTTSTGAKTIIGAQGDIAFTAKGVAYCKKSGNEYLIMVAGTEVSRSPHPAVGPYLLHQTATGSKFIGADGELYSNSPLWLNPGFSVHECPQLSLPQLAKGGWWIVSENELGNLNFNHQGKSTSFKRSGLTPIYRLGSQPVMASIMGPIKVTTMDGREILSLKESGDLHSASRSGSKLLWRRNDYSYVYVNLETSSYETINPGKNNQAFAVWDLSERLNIVVSDFRKPLRRILISEVGK